MRRQAPLVSIVIAAVLAVLAGCHPQQPFYLKSVDCDLAHYKGVATEIEYPDVDSERLSDAANAAPPLSLINNKEREIWNLTLEEAIQIALKNNKVMRNIGGQVQGPPELILRNPAAVPTTYDPAIADTDPRTSVEAALSAFDAQFASSLMWERTDAPQNVNQQFVSEGFFANVSEHDIGKFQAQLSKVAASGGQFSLTHTVAYDRDRFDYLDQPMSSGLTPYAYPSDWNVNLTAEWRQPLLQGAGTQFNRIAGPGATPGQFNGVMVARINTDIALADFEAGVRNLVSDVEIAYWELYFNYRSLDAVVAGRDSALVTWRKVYTLYTNGSKGGEAEQEAQARQQYFLFRSNAERSLNDLYVTEAKLRYLLGLAATDGRLIRPKDEPTTAKTAFDWCDILNEGLARSVELRQQKWIVKRRELELIAAKNFLLPKLDFDAQYRYLGLGNDLFPVANGEGSDFTQIRSNAYQSLTNGQFQEWQLGFQLNMPLGFRREMAGVRNAQLILTRERSKLQEGELELSHQLAFAIRDLQKNYVLSQTEFNRRIAAQREVDTVTAAFETGTVTIDRVLDAQQKLAQAESDYFRALVDYNKSISAVHFRKGSLLEYNGVYLAEGPWPAKAYFDARGRARARDASTYMDYGFTQPKVISRGPIDQQAGGGTMFQGSTPESTPAPAQPEPVPTPEPIRPGTLPAEPALQPVPQPQASATEGGDISGWTAAANRLPTATVADQQVRPTGGTSTEKGGYHEPVANPPPAGDDRPASGWTGVQR
jgi:outer membrane protein TolC